MTKRQLHGDKVADFKFCMSVCVCVVTAGVTEWGQMADC